MKGVGIIILFLAIGWMPAFAHSDTLSVKKLSVNVSPFSLIDINDGPALRAGIEFRSSRRIALCADGKQYFYFPSGANWVEKKAVAGYALMPGIKLFVGKPPITPGSAEKYVLLRYSYKDQAYTLTDSVTANNIHSYKSFRMHQYTSSLAVCYGEATTGRKYLKLDWYVGLGVRSIRSSSDLSSGEKAYDYHDWTVDLTFYPNTSTGNLIYPSLLLGQTVGYQFH